jgi:phosphohistidine phosphatase SixA
MKLLLMRHSDRELAGSEQEQPLTQSGRDKAKVIAKKIRDKLSSEEGIDVVLSSSSRPATETAEIVNASLNLSHKVVLVDCLDPSVHDLNFNDVIEFLEKYRDKEVILLVMHEPLLSRLIRELSSEPVYNTYKAEVYCLRVTDSEGKILWKVKP